MEEKVDKKWYNSSNKWVYLRVAFLSLTTPAKVYELAHKSHSANVREKIIRGRLLEAGVLSNNNSNLNSNIDLEKGHI